MFIVATLNQVENFGRYIQVLDKVGYMVLLTRPSYAHIDPLGGLINIPPGLDLVGHNTLHVTIRLRKGKTRMIS